MQRNQSGTPPRILTFNHHESFLCALSGLSATFDVVVKKGALDLSWNTRNRSVPSNFRLITFEEASLALQKGAYDWVVCHTIKNLFWLLPYQRRRLIFVAHIPLFKNSTFLRIKSAVKKATVLFWQKFFGLKVIAVSPFKQKSWNIPSDVARFFPVPFPPELVSPSKGTEIRGAYVGNDIIERGEELGWGVLKDILAVSPVQVIGFNPGLKSPYIPADFRDFVGEFSRAHFYVYTVGADYGDGYNTAMLEAMLLGLPVVTLPNPSSPIVHEVNGLVAKDAQGLNAAIARLIADGPLRERLGAAARETVERDFSAQAFWAVWSRVLKIPTPNSASSPSSSPLSRPTGESV